MNKTAIKNFAISARTKLIAMAIDKAGIIGITKDGASKASSSGKDFAIFPTYFGKETRLEENDIQQRQNLVNKIKQDGFDVTIEEVAYTWFNRIIAVRFMEVNNYLPTGVRVLSSETAGKFEPDIVTQAPEVGLDFTDAEKDEIYILKDDPRKSGELFKKLFIKQCNALSKILPELFENTSFGSKDFTEILLDLSWDKEDGVVRELLAIEETDFLEAVEIIGWMYQYYNTEPKEETFALLKKNVKITKERIPSATQLFTPDWIVRYMVENSLGRLWLEGHPDTTLKADWKYYLDEAEQEESVKLELEKIRADYKNIKLEEIKLIDPCMGSGHILVYAFDVLMQIYLSCGYTKEDAVISILQHNLYGLDIDKRAFQLTYFALNMKARSYDRRFLTHTVAPQVYAIEGSNNLNGYRLMGQLSFDDLYKADINYLIDAFQDAKEYGSILQLDRTIDYDALYDRVSEQQQLDGQLDLETVTFDRQKTELLYIIALAKTLSQQYDVVVTNPPYMGSSGMGSKLADYVKKNYPETKSDMFACFIEKGFSMAKRTGFISMITMESWMFLSSFEKMRQSIVANKTIVNMVHMPYLGKGGTSLGINFGTAAVVFNNKKISNYAAQYDYVCYYETDDNGIPFEFPVINERYKTATTENFKKIPGSPIAYWVSEKFIESYSLSKIGDVGDTKTGLQTGNNDVFLKQWFEVSNTNIAFNMTNKIEYLSLNKKWVPQIKGGSYRKWYGNFDYVVNWLNDGREIRNHSGCRLNAMANDYLFFKSGLTWSHTTSGGFGARYMPKGALFNVEAPSCFVNDIKIEKYVLAFLNSVVTQYILDAINSTLHYLTSDIKGLPINIPEEKNSIDNIVSQNISLSQTDWDSFETSWDFEKHPLV